MLETCFVDDKTIVIHTDSDNSIIESLINLPIATILCTNGSANNIAIEHHAKMNLFLTTANSSDQLNARLQSFKYSPWWNIMASFFILDRLNIDCQNGLEMLRTAWKINIVTTFFVCLDSQGYPMIYTYNPYTERAPSPWIKVEGTIEQSDRWTMYKQPFDNGEAFIYLFFF